MKQLAAIAFSLLLIVAQTFAVQVPVSSGVAVVSAGCCCDDCQCCVGESSAPVAPPVESTAPVPAHNFFALPPVASVSFMLALPVNELPPHQTAFLLAAAQPLHRRNCALLI